MLLGWYSRLPGPLSMLPAMSMCAYRTVGLPSLSDSLLRSSRPCCTRRKQCERCLKQNSTSRQTDTHLDELLKEDGCACTSSRCASVAQVRIRAVDGVKVLVVHGHFEGKSEVTWESASA